jgi:hypothetical protein
MSFFFAIFNFFTSHSQVKAKAKEHAAHSREAREPDHSFLSSKHAELVTIQSCQVKRSLPLAEILKPLPTLGSKIKT